MDERDQLRRAIAHLETPRPQLGDALVDTSTTALREKLATPCTAMREGAPLLDGTRRISMSRIDLLQANPLFAGLPADVLEAVAAKFGRRSFAKGMVLFHKGSLGQRLYLIESGQVRIFVLSDGGHEITLNIHGPGECFGELALLDGGPRSAGALALERTVACTLGRQDFLALVEVHPSLARNALALVSQRLRHLTSLIESLAFQDVSGRVAACLLDMAERHGQPGRQGIVLPVHLTQSELASCVAATRESVNKVIGALRDEGLIWQEGHVLTILDVERLRLKVG